MSSLRIGLAGAGHIAATHLAAWRRAPGCRLEGIFDRRREAAEERARQFRLSRVHDSFASLVADCDVIDLCTPPHTHAELAREVLAAGRHLLCEKPIVTRLSDWEELSGLAAGSAGSLAVVHNVKYVAAVRRARRWLEQGRIGRPFRLTRIFFTDPASDRMLAAPHWSHELPGGRWFETLPHALYLTHQLMGPLDLASVTALATAAAPVGAPADEVAIVLRGADRLADVHYSANCGLNRRWLTVWGTDGRIEIDLLSDSAYLDRVRDSRPSRALAGLPQAAGRAVRWPLDRAAYVASRLQGHSPHAALIADFARHLRGEGPSPTPLEEIDYVVRTADAIGREIDRQARDPVRG